MKYLIDTHILLWFALDDPRLEVKWKDILEDETNEVFVSVASLWEIAIKHSLGKIELARPPEAFFAAISDELHFSLLGIERSHLLQLIQLPFHHRDPFDRIIIAQSLAQKLFILSSDQIFEKYRNEDGPAKDG